LPVAIFIGRNPTRGDRMVDQSSFNRTLAEFARTLVRGYDISEVLYDLSERVVGMLGVTGAGVTSAMIRISCGSRRPAPVRSRPGTRPGTAGHPPEIVHLGHDRIVRAQRGSKGHCPYGRARGWSWRGRRGWLGVSVPCRSDFGWRALAPLGRCRSLGGSRHCLPLGRAATPEAGRVPGQLAAFGSAEASVLRVDGVA